MGETVTIVEGDVCVLWLICFADLFTFYINCANFAPQLIKLEYELN